MRAGPRCGNHMRETVHTGTEWPSDYALVILAFRRKTTTTCRCFAQLAAANGVTHVLPWWQQRTLASCVVNMNNALRADFLCHKSCHFVNIVANFTICCIEYFYDGFVTKGFNGYGSCSICGRHKPMSTEEPIISGYETVTPVAYWWHMEQMPLIYANKETLTKECKFHWFKLLTKHNLITKILDVTAISTVWYLRG